MNESRSCCDAEDKKDVSREDVRSFYSNAALASQESLCCPTQYDPEDLSHIPEAVREISYGCGSPVSRANIRQGDTVVDLGSGGGIDCFIAAKLVGESGNVIGIDMTDEMLQVAQKNALSVAENLGYSNVEFKKGYLETIPLKDQSVDLVTSNCVINLSTNKKEVFEEINRILKPGGRFVIADIISEKEVPQEMQNQRELWGECISGALTLSQFLEAARPHGFHGFQIKKDYLWKIVEGVKFYSYTLEACKSAEPKTASGCGEFTATYAGPFDSITHNGDTYPVGVPVDIDEGLAQLMQTSPYAQHFIVTDHESETPTESKDSDSCCG
jgi:SAM-dependent methyltransferase